MIANVKARFSNGTLVPLEPLEGRLLYVHVCHPAPTDEWLHRPMT